MSKDTVFTTAVLKISEALESGSLAKVREAWKEHSPTLHICALGNSFREQQVRQLANQVIFALLNRKGE